MSTEEFLGSARGKRRHPRASAAFASGLGSPGLASASASAGGQVSFQKKSLVRRVACSSHRPLPPRTQLCPEMPLPQAGAPCGVIGLNLLAGSLPGWLPRGQMSRASSRGKASVPGQPSDPASRPKPRWSAATCTSALHSASRFLPAGRCPALTAIAVATAITQWHM